MRVEQLYPWPYDRLAEVVARYPGAQEIVWLQEEPANMGAWAFAQDRLAERFADTHTVLRVSRYESGSPATGSHTIHVQEQEAILDAALTVDAGGEEPVRPRGAVTLGDQGHKRRTFRSCARLVDNGRYRAGGRSAAPPTRAT